MLASLPHHLPPTKGQEKCQSSEWKNFSEQKILVYITGKGKPHWGMTLWLYQWIILKTNSDQGLLFFMAVDKESSNTAFMASRQIQPYLRHHIEFRKTREEHEQ